MLTGKTYGSSVAEKRVPEKRRLAGGISYLTCLQTEIRFAASSDGFIDLSYKRSWPVGNINNHQYNQCMTVK